MANLTDHQLVAGPEAVAYGTKAATFRSFEMLSKSSIAWDQKPIQGAGLRPARNFPRADRRKPGYGQGKPVISIEAVTTGMGTLLNACLGNGQSTLVPGEGSTTYQQLYSSGLGGTVLPSLTAQLGIVRSDDTGTVDPYTLRGCTVSDWSIECPSAEKLILEATLDALALDTDTALVEWEDPAYTGFYTSWAGSVSLGGTITPPTATALATGGSPLAEVRNWKLSVANKIDDSGWVVGGRRRPRFGARTATFEAEVYYVDQTFVDALREQTPVGIVIAHTAGSLSTGLETLQLCVPAFLVDDGAIPDPTDDGAPTVAKLKTTVALDADDDEAFYVACRTADTAI